MKTNHPPLPFSIGPITQSEFDQLAPLFEEWGLRPYEVPNFKHVSINEASFFDFWPDNEVTSDDSPKYDLVDFRQWLNPFNLDCPSPLAYQTPGAAGFDIPANEALVLQPMQRASVSTGIFIRNMPTDLELQIRPRSGLALKHGITVLNTPGTIDSDYKQEVKVILINLGEHPFEIKPGDRIAQGVFHKVERPACIPVLGNKREGGFGSTGV